MRNVRLSTDHCFSVFQRYTHNSRAGYCLALGERSLRALPFARILLRAYSDTRKIMRPYRSADRCFKHATKSIVALDTAWPWANDIYGLCCLRAYFCAYKTV